MSVSDGHLSDAELTTLLDDRTQAAPATTHLERCQDCRGRLGELRQASARLSELLELGGPTLSPPRYDPEVLDVLGVALRPSRAAAGRAASPRRSPALPWLVGLVAATLVGLVLVATPAGAWLADHLTSVLRAGAAAVSGDPAPERSTPHPGGSPTAVDFQPTEPILTVRLEDGRVPSAVVARRGDGDLVTADLRPGREGAWVVVAPGALRIRADRTDTLQLTLPPAVREVRVYLGDRLLGARPVEAIGTTEPWVLPVS